MSIQTQVILELKKKPSIKLGELKQLYPEVKPASLKTAFYRGKKSLMKGNFSETIETLSEVGNSKISIELMEKLLLKEHNKGSNPNILRLMTDFLKIKQQDHSELKEIDLEKFYKIGMED